MKTQIMLLVIAMLFLTTSVLATEVHQIAEDKPVTYEVRITVVYNAVDGDTAAGILVKALSEHGEKACSIKVTAKKNGNIDNTISWVTATGDITSTGTNPYYQNN